MVDPGANLYSLLGASSKKLCHNVVLHFTLGKAQHNTGIESRRRRYFPLIDNLHDGGEELVEDVFVLVNSLACCA